MNQRYDPAFAAECVLRAFGGSDVGTTISYSQLEDYFKENQWSLRSTTAGLQFARREQWISVDSFHAITLLENGRAEAIKLNARSEA